MRFIKGFGQFWYDFLIGDDWKIAAAVVLVLSIAGIFAFQDSVPSTVITAVTAVGLLVAFTLALVVDVRRSERG